MNYYILKDIRWERKDGKPSYVYYLDAAQATYDLHNAQTFRTKKDALRAVKVWEKLNEYYNADAWVTIIKKGN